MSSHFDCIGLPVRDEAALQELVERIWGELGEEDRAGNARHLRWTDASGARGARELAGQELGPHEDPDRTHCGGVDVDVLADGETSTRSTVQWLHFQPYRSWLQSPRTYSLTPSAMGAIALVEAWLVGRPLEAPGG